MTAERDGLQQLVADYEAQREVMQSRFRLLCCRCATAVAPPSWAVTPMNTPLAFLTAWFLVLQAALDALHEYYVHSEAEAAVQANELSALRSRIDELGDKANDADRAR